jgi:peptidoglycan hydrolase-like protein with peptidoglycan-binding domain
MTSRRASRTRRTAVLALGVLIAVLAAGSAWWVQHSTPSPITADEPSGPLVVPVTTGERVDRYGVGVAAGYEDGVAVGLQAAGTVTHLPLAAGDVLENGSVVVVVDDAPIVAYASDAPLWRDLDTGARGQDVARLQRFLRELGLYRGGDDGRFEAATARAVRAFNTQHGKPDQGSAFTVSSVAWIGPSPVHVATVEVAAGSTVAPGSVVVRGPRRPTSIAVTEPTGGIPAGSDYELVVNGLAAPYVPGSGAITDPQAVAAIAASLGTTGEGAGQVTSTGGESVLRVPASAIVVDPSGASCVFEDVDGDPVAVTVLGGTLASAELAPEAALTRVLANPLRVLEDPTCDSSPKA